MTRQRGVRITTECDNCFERGTLRVVSSRQVEPSLGVSLVCLAWDIAVLTVCALGVLLVGLVRFLSWLLAAVLNRQCQAVKNLPAAGFPPQVQLRSNRVTNAPQRTDPAVRAPRRPRAGAATTKAPPRDVIETTAAREASLDEQVQALAKALHKEHGRVMSPETALVIARRHLEQQQQTAATQGRVAV